MLIISTSSRPIDRGRCERSHVLLAPMILLGDVNAPNSLQESEKMSTRGRMLKKILDRFNLLCLNENEESYYQINNRLNTCQSNNSSRIKIEQRMQTQGN